MNDDPVLYFQIERLFAEYCSCLDEDRLEEWPELFTDDGFYKMISRENHAHGYPIPLVQFDSRAMMRDRVFSLRHANIYQPHRYRHALSGTRVLQFDEAEWVVSTSYIVVQTLIEGSTEIYQAGSYYDRLVQTSEGLRFRQRVVVYDTSRVQTLLATPV
jgi:anthranilate 1,2-dioxygenase small subunit